MKTARLLSELGGFSHDIAGTRDISLILMFKEYKNKGTDLLS